MVAHAGRGYSASATPAAVLHGVAAQPSAPGYHAASDAPDTHPKAWRGEPCSSIVQLPTRIWLQGPRQFYSNFGSHLVDAGIAHHLG